MSQHSEPLAVQPVPTDAEIEAAIEEYGDAKLNEGISDIAGESGWGAAEGLPDPAATSRANLLRLIAQQREAAVREALEAVREWCVESGVYTFVIDHIDTMLAKEDGDE